MKLDHVGIIAGDLSAAAVRYEQLGFCLGPLARHRGPVPPTKVVNIWGVANRCAMLHNGYIEIAGIIDDSLFINGFDEMLATGEGCHIVALEGSDLATTARDLRGRGFSAPEPVSLSRPLEDGSLSFRLVRLPRHEMPEARFVLLTHETPELLKSSSPTEHPNGARGLVEVIFGVQDLGEARDRFARLAGTGPEQDGTEFASFNLNGTWFTLASPDHLTALAPGADASRHPFAAAFVVEVDSVARSRAVLDGNGVSYQRNGAELAVAPEWGAGAGCVFRQAS